MALILVLGLPSAGDASSQASEQVQQRRAEALRVFLDCPRCDFDYLRTHITFVNYVRDRRDAQVHVLVTSEPAGGGTAVTLDFLGLEDMSGLDDQLIYHRTHDDTDDSERRQMAQLLRLGLARYAARTPLGLTLDVRSQTDALNPSLGARPEDDPWNFWVFRTRVNTTIQGEERTTAKSIGGSFSANRTTDEWKLTVGLNVDYNESSFQLSDSTFTTTRRNHALTGFAIRSLGEHVGAGVGGSVVTTTFRNQNLALRLAPAIEYNVYPYTESTRRQLTIRYAVGLDSFDYEEPTIFNVSSERRVSHSLATSFDVNAPWGISDLTVEWSQFLDDPAKYRTVLFGDLELRLFRGFFLSLSGSGSMVRDQIYLPRRGSTDEEILVRQRELATAYDYGFSVGFTFAFGSIFNNVVNSRFGGSNGGFVRAF